MVLVGSVDCCVVGLRIVLLFATGSSSSDEMSTTIWADIIGCGALAELAILWFKTSQTLEQGKGSMQAIAPQGSLLRVADKVVSWVVVVELS